MLLKRTIADTAVNQLNTWQSFIFKHFSTRKIFGASFITLNSGMAGKTEVNSCLGEIIFLPTQCDMFHDIIIVMKIVDNPLWTAYDHHSHCHQPIHGYQPLTA
jgi:hypothetical protein